MELGSCGDRVEADVLGARLGREGHVPWCSGGDGLVFQAQVMTWFTAQLLEVQLFKRKGWLLVSEWFAPSPSYLEEESMCVDG